MPFAVVGSNTVIEVRGRKMRGRMYPWGVVEVENPEHCDFIKLRTLLVSVILFAVSFVVCCFECTVTSFRHFYSTAALLAMQSSVLATAIPSVCLSVRHRLVLYPDK